MPRPTLTLVPTPVSDGLDPDLVAAVERATGYRLILAPRLPSGRIVEVNYRDRQIRMFSGYPASKRRQIVGRAVLYILGGADLAPEFRSGPALQLIEA